MLGVAREAWEEADYEVRGAALSGIAAEGLESGSGIASRTIASLEHGWEQGCDLLTDRDVLVIDEAGMVGTRQLERVLSHAHAPAPRSCWSAIRSSCSRSRRGAAFRSLHERHGGVEIGEVRRHWEDWQREATRDLATGRTGAALNAYDGHGMVHAAETREAARADLVYRWDRDRQAAPETSRIILTHTNDEVRALNEAARARMRAAGDLGTDVDWTVERGARQFSAGDRVMFLRNERSLGVKNGTLGTIEEVSAQDMAVRTDDGRSVRFKLTDYDRIDHGYAATIHKAQGMTVDRAHVLATPGMDAHGAYVALSRHRDGVDLHYSHDDFEDRDRLVRTLSRDRAKDMALDYEKKGPLQTYAEQRGIDAGALKADLARDPAETLYDWAHRRDGGPIPPEMEPPEDPVEVEMRRIRGEALKRHARACDAILEVKREGLAPSADQRRELGAARDAFDKVRRYGWQDAEAAYNKDNSLAREAATGRTRRAIRALQLETEIRTGASLRADRFVDRWQKLDRANTRQYREGDYAGYRATRAEMGEMARGLSRDPQVESLLANRKRELGITFDSGRSLGRELAFSQGIDFELGRSRGLGI